MARGTFAAAFQIDNKSIGSDHPVYIVAEAGVAHFGSEEKAYRLVDLAVSAGADAVKFQVFDVNALIAEESREWKERLGSRQLPHEAFTRIQGYCRASGITFFATAHDEPSLRFLSSLNVPAYKIGSGEVGNWPFVRLVASQGKPVILSTGMYRAEQIGDALSEIAEAGNPNLAVLHCVTSYPTAPADVSLRSMALIRDTFQVVTGYSDHTRGVHFCLAAVALGAKVIEKHISLDFDVPNAQDWKVSCGPHDFGDFIGQVREIEAGLAQVRSGPNMAEETNMGWAAKSLVALHDLPANTALQASDLIAKRPGTGISPSRIGEVIGRLVKTDLPKDAVIKWEHLK